MFLPQRTGVVKKGEKECEGRSEEDQMTDSKPGDHQRYCHNQETPVMLHPPLVYCKVKFWQNKGEVSPPRMNYTN